LFPAFIPLFLAPPQPAPGAIHQAERRDRQQRQEEKKNLSDWMRKTRLTMHPPIQQGHRRRVYNTQSGGWLQFQSRPALSLSRRLLWQQTAATYYIYIPIDGT
jgi:hypothetical protein